MALPDPGDGVSARIADRIRLDARRPEPVNLGEPDLHLLWYTGARPSVPLRGGGSLVTHLPEITGAADEPATRLPTPGWLSRHIAFEDQAQADQSQPGLVSVDQLHLIDHQRCETTGRDDRDRCGIGRRQLCGHPACDALDLAGEAIDDPGLQCLHGVLTNDPARPGQLYLE